MVVVDNVRARPYPGPCVVAGYSPAPSLHPRQTEQYGQICNKKETKDKAVRRMRAHVPLEKGGKW